MVQHLEILVGTHEVKEGNARLDVKASKYDHPNFVHDREKGTVQLKAKEGANVEQLVPVELTPREIGLLTELEQAPNKARATKELKEKVFGENYSEKTVRSYISSLRRKLEPDPKHPEIFLRRKGVGWVFIDESRNLSRQTVCDDKDQQKKTEQSQRTYSYRGFTWYPDRFVIDFNGKEINFTKIESNILGLLIQNDGSVIARRRLCQEIRFDDPSLDHRFIDQHISRIRKKLKVATREDFIYIETIHKVGYRLVDETNEKREIPYSATVYDARSS